MSFVFLWNIIYFLLSILYEKYDTMIYEKYEFFEYITK